MCEDSKIYDNLEQEILEAVARTDFLVFCNNFPYEDREILQAKLIELHNLGKIDTVAEFCHLRNSDSSEIDFFRLRHIFAKILPHISADLEPTALCVSNLIEESGQGMVTQTIVDSLEEFCKQKEQYPEELLMLALTQNTLRRFLTLALVVGMHFDLSKYFNHAIRLIEENSDDEIQRQAIVALRFCSSLEMQMVERIINCLNKQLTFRQLIRFPRIFAWFSEKSTLLENTNRNHLLC